MPIDLISSAGGKSGAELTIPLGIVIQFGLVLSRMAGLLTFLPIPGLRSGFDLQRLTVAVLFSVLTMPWTAVAKTWSMTLGDFLKLAGSEAALGISLGLCVAVIGEGIQMGAQMLGLQAGFSYASTIDPSSNADSAILQVLLSLSTALTFLALGLDTILFRLLLMGLQAMPPGEWTLDPQHASAVMALFPLLFCDAIRFALPVVAILLVIDAALALLSRIQPQLQLLMLSFPLKMLAAMVFLAQGAPLLPGAVERAALRSFEAMQFLIENPATLK